ncbi:MAG: ABC transporter ATP-binding protein [Dissulfurimicrobium sp.]|uniref:ABC transporter ATP-binding protein n=1 Tax=Dissulfurimicrobium TaxID=1769732 RepID=UPI003C709400
MIKPYAPRVIAAIIFGLLVSAFDGAIAWLVKPVMDRIFVEHQYKYIFYLPVGIVILYALRGAADFAQSYLMRTAGFRMVRDLRDRFFQNLISLPLSVVTKSSSGDMVSRQMNDVSLMSGILSESFRTFLVEVPKVIVLAGIAIYRQWDLALLSFALFPFIAYGTKTLSWFVRKKRKIVQQYMAILTHRMNEMVMGIKVIKIFGMEKMKIAQFKRENQISYRQNAKVIMLKEATQYLIGVLSGVSIAIILGYGGLLVAKGKMTSGDFFSILAAITIALNPLKKIGGAYNIFQETIGVMERVDQFMDFSPEPVEGLPVCGLHKGIEFKSVCFTYPGSDLKILHDINLEIPQGKVIAIVGPSGAGKSTIIDLIPRFITPTKGVILWDGVDLERLNLIELRRNIAIVSQDIILFSDTIRENIAAGRPDATEEDIEQAARLANAHDFIMTLPQGYNAVLDERGLNLSGGQRQRIALARAILKNPPLLILDEATSALDTASEQAIQKALAIVMKGRTTIVVAHRLSTIQNADEIIVLDKGRIAARGTHSELLERSPLYNGLYLNLTSRQTPNNDEAHLSEVDQT